MIKVLNYIIAPFKQIAWVLYFVYDKVLMSIPRRLFATNKFVINIFWPVVIGGVILAVLIYGELQRRPGGVNEGPSFRCDPWTGVIDYLECQYMYDSR